MPERIIWAVRTDRACMLGQGTCLQDDEDLGKQLVDVAPVRGAGRAREERQAGDARAHDLRDLHDLLLAEAHRAGRSGGGRRQACTQQARPYGADSQRLWAIILLGCVRSWQAGRRVGPKP